MTAPTGNFQGKECECSSQDVIAAGTYTTGEEYGMVPETVRQMLCTKCGFKWELLFQTLWQKRFTTLLLNHDDDENGPGPDEDLR